MAQVEKTRILKQSHCTFVYSLIKSFTYFFPIRSCQSFFNAIPQRQKQFLLSTANGRRPMHAKRKRSKYKVTDSFKTHSLTY